ncbi:MAG: glutamine synthetase type III, partial [Clostridia bacterium]|nr:glutamine synthetase type III [Clostridia bacterium]
APPAVISIFLGEDLTDLLESIANGLHHDDVKREKMKMGADVIPEFKKDNSDRNRTSPFAFTGNKFEFRMLGSSSSISDTNVMLNTMVADVFMEYSERLEKATDLEAEITAIIKNCVENHKRIIFNGDGYSKEWEEEAEKRGLLNLKSTVDALPLLKTEENVALFERHGVFNRAEIDSRVDIILENYAKTVHIEALTLMDMMNRDVIPAITAYVSSLCEAVNNKNLIRADASVEYELITRLSAANKEIFTLTSDLKAAVASAERSSNIFEKASEYRNIILKIMADIRKYADSAECVVPREAWPYPSYGDLLFKI